MSKTFFIADTHFSSENIIAFENRPFKDALSMDEALINNWNNVVSPDDIVWHLGDFGAEGQESEILKRLNGTKYLVLGNHDTYSMEYYKNAGFAWVYDHPVIIEDFWILSHSPIYINVNMPYANVFGHVHSSPIFKDFSQWHMCVCAERTDYTPVDFEYLKKNCLEKQE